MEEIKTVVVCGAFDPLHIGHLEHIRLARQLGDRLVVIMNPDADVIQKRGGLYITQPMGQRYQLLKALKWVDDVVIAIDGDGTIAKTLLMLKPNVLAKGGDRNQSNMPTNEIEACKKIHCKIVYGVGEVLDSSSAQINRIRAFAGEIQHKPTGDFK